MGDMGVARALLTCILSADNLLRLKTALPAGGIKELSDFFDKGLITMQLRKYARELGMPHPGTPFSIKKKIFGCFSPPFLSFSRFLRYGRSVVLRGVFATLKSPT